MKAVSSVFCALLLCAGALTPARGQGNAVDPVRERQRIADERTAAETHFAERQRECLQHFVVTPCVDDAKRERRETLSRLMREQNLLDDSQRKLRAAERTEAIRQRASAEAARDAEAKASREGGESRADVPAGSGSAESKRTIPSATGAKSAHESKDRTSTAKDALPFVAGQRRGRAEEERSRATFDAAQRDAAVHRAEVEAHNARRATQHPPAAPLPLPPGASAP